MRMFNTTNVILAKCVYISREEILSNLSVFRALRKIICEIDPYMLLSQTIGMVRTFYCLVFEIDLMCTILAAVIKNWFII